ncbi:polysaccharide biosynthesis/export family protein [Asaia krungthepensis]|nr:polysaccharide biosynthesis/export family protein [Asaia krungthepensis]
MVHKSFGAYRLCLAAIGVSLAGCNALPDSGPSERGVLSSVKKEGANPLGFEIRPVDMKTISILSDERPPLLSSLDVGHMPVVYNDRIGRGDMLSVSVFEVGNSLFSSATHAGSAGISGSTPATSAGASNTELPPAEVEADGTFGMPYVGRIKAAGLTPRQVADVIQQGLKGKTDNPQVMVHIVRDIGNTVIVSGEVERPGRVVLSSARERLSDLIAIAGGAKWAPQDTYVQLLRNGKTGGTDLGTLQSHPDLDVAGLPGDRIQIIYEPRSYTVFGASDRVSETQFKSPDLTLAEAIARAGGPNDARADPNAVFLFRFEDVPAARQMGLTTPSIRQGIHDGVPVIYHLDMMNPTSYFLAQHFPMKNKDVLLVANARTNRFYKFNQLIGALTGPAITAAWVAK